MSHFCHSSMALVPWQRQLIQFCQCTLIMSAYTYTLVLSNTCTPHSISLSTRGDGSSRGHASFPQMRTVQKTPIFSLSPQNSSVPRPGLIGTGWVEIEWVEMCVGIVIFGPLLVHVQMCSMRKMYGCNAANGGLILFTLNLSERFLPRVRVRRLTIPNQPFYKANKNKLEHGCPLFHCGVITWLI